MSTKHSTLSTDQVSHRQSHRSSCIYMAVHNAPLRTKRFHKAGQRPYQRQTSCPGATTPSAVPLRGTLPRPTLPTSLMWCNVRFQWLQAQWYEDSDITPVRRPGCPRSAQWMRAHRTIAGKLSETPCELSWISVGSLASRGGQVGGLLRSWACVHVQVRDIRNWLLGTRTRGWSEREASCGSSETDSELGSLLMRRASN